METEVVYYPTIKKVEKAAETLRGVSVVTPLQHNRTYSRLFDSNVNFKREDQQVVRSYKLRGAYNKIKSLPQEALKKGIVCASAGNHAQGVAYSCHQLGVYGRIYMPFPTPTQKVEQVKMFGGVHIEIVLTGDTFDDAYEAAINYSESENMTFIHPFNDEKVIEGQATIGLEVLNQSSQPIDYLFLPVGGGGLAAGVSSVFRSLSPDTKIVGVEPKGAPSMSASLKENKLVKLNHIDRFVDGAAVKQVGQLNFEICRQNLHQMATVAEGKICETILNVYNKDGLVLEPAGALTIAVLDRFKDEIKGKNVVCLLSGSNNDVTRMEEMKEKALLYQGLKHYFLIDFPQRAGALKEFVNDILGPSDDISYFEYYKKNSREKGPAIVGIELKEKEDFQPLIHRMKDKSVLKEYLNDKPELMQVLV